MKKGYMAAAWILLLFLAVLLIFFMREASARIELVAYEYEVERGDTLDGLYYKYGGGDLAKWRYLVEKINGMDGAELYAGDTITILVDAGDSDG